MKASGRNVQKTISLIEQKILMSQKYFCLILYETMIELTNSIPAPTKYQRVKKKKTNTFMTRVLLSGPEYFTFPSIYMQSASVSIR